MLKFVCCLFSVCSLFSTELLLIQDFTPGDEILKTPFFHDIQKDLKTKNIKIKTFDPTEDTSKKKEILGYLVWNRPVFLKRKILKKIPPEKSVLFIWEPPVIQKDLHSSTFWNRFKRIYTWDDALVDNSRFFKFYYPSLKPMMPNPPPFEQRKLLTFIFSNKESSHPDALYAERDKVVRFFEEKKGSDFEFYGRGWESKRYKNYRGEPEHKLDILKNFRFAICYENMQHIKGYITEKIFDCFEAGTIPIYLGASNIEEHIPSSCFIDRRKFKSEDELYIYIKNIDESAYRSYIQHIEDFLKSEKGKPFTHPYFQKTLQEAIDAF